MLLFTEGPFWNEKEWNETDLESAKRELRTLHEVIRSKKDFNYPENSAVCRHCAYYEGNYCGIRTRKIPPNPIKRGSSSPPLLKIIAPL